MRHNERPVSECQHSGGPNNEIQSRIQNLKCCFFVCSCHVWYCTWTKVCGDRVVFCFWLSRALVCGRCYLISTIKDNTNSIRMELQELCLLCSCRHWAAECVFSCLIWCNQLKAGLCCATWKSSWALQWVCTANHRLSMPCAEFSHVCHTGSNIALVAEDLGWWESKGCCKGVRGNPVKPWWITLLQSLFRLGGKLPLIRVRYSLKWAGRTESDAL